MYACPCCQQPEPSTKVDVVSVGEAVDSDRLSPDEAFKRTYMGNGRQSSVSVFQGHRGPFRKHLHVSHDEIGYVLSGSGSVTVGDVTRPLKAGDVFIIPSHTPHSGEFMDEPVEVLLISSPIDDPENPDRVWL